MNQCLVCMLLIIIEGNGMIVKIVLPVTGELNPVSVYSEKELLCVLEQVDKMVYQELKGDTKGFFEADIVEGTVRLGNRTDARCW